jgi:hypothetical protein
MTPTTSLRLRRRGVAAVAAAAALPLLSACATYSPATTMVPYNASDGTSLQLGQIEGANLLVVGSEKGGEGVLSGALVNNGTEAVQVAISTQGAPTPVTVTVPAQGLVRLTADSTASSTGSAGSATILVPSLAAAPGALVTVQMATRAAGQTQALVPVIPPQQEYATITPPPTTAPATQSPTGTGEPSSDESGEPTTSPS